MYLMKTGKMIRTAGTHLFRFAVDLFKAALG